MDIVEQMRSFESDHEPDGWPAIQMKQVSALCDEIERLRSIINAANAQEPVDYERMLNGEWVTCSKTRYEVTSDPVRALYARPIPAQQSQVATSDKVLFNGSHGHAGYVVEDQQSPAVAVPDDWSGLDQEDFDLVLDWLKQQELEINVGQVSGDFDDYVRSSAGILLSLIESARDYFQSIAIKSPPITTEPKLDKPARVNATNFMTGVPVRMVIEAAQRYYEWRQENPPEKDSEMQKKFFAAIDCIKKPSISKEQLLEIAASAIASVQSFTGLAANHAQRWLENEGVELVENLKFNSVMTPSPRITEQDALPAGYREEWKRNVMLMWSCVRKHDSSIPSDVLDYMREQLLDKLNEVKHD